MIRTFLLPIALVTTLMCVIHMTVPEHPASQAPILNAQSVAQLAETTMIGQHEPLRDHEVTGICVQPLTNPVNPEVIINHFTFVRPGPGETLVVGDKVKIMEVSDLTTGSSYLMAFGKKESGQ